MLTLDALKRIAFLSTHKQTDSSYIFLFECGSSLVRRFKCSSSASKDFLEFMLFSYICTQYDYLKNLF